MTSHGRQCKGTANVCFLTAHSEMREAAMVLEEVDCGKMQVEKPLLLVLDVHLPRLRKEDACRSAADVPNAVCIACIENISAL